MNSWEVVAGRLSKMGVKIVTPDVNGCGGCLKELVAKGAGRC